MYILLFFNIIFICIILYYQKNKKKYLNKYIQKKEKEIESALASKRTESSELDASIQLKRDQLDVYQELIKDSQLQHTTLQRNLNSFESTGRRRIEVQLEELKQQKIKNLELQLAKEMNDRREQVEADYIVYLMNIREQQKAAEGELSKIKAEVENFRIKQETINQEILRRRELEEQTDFYRVCLSNEAIADINLLQITRQNLKKPEIIDKIIYDNYVAKPVLEMIKRVLQNTTCSGIYKITCQETKEIYIGKSTDIKNRWQQHCKTAFNCGTIASSILHRKMQQYGIENFTFELLEKVPKEQLSEREKYYIDFYKTKETGLNERSG